MNEEKRDPQRWADFLNALNACNWDADKSFPAGKKKTVNPKTKQTEWTTTFVEIISGMKMKNNFRKIRLASDFDIKADVISMEDLGTFTDRNESNKIRVRVKMEFSIIDNKTFIEYDRFTSFGIGSSDIGREDSFAKGYAYRGLLDRFQLDRPLYDGDSDGETINNAPLTESERANERIYLENNKIDSKPESVEPAASKTKTFEDENILFFRIKEKYIENNIKPPAGAIKEWKEINASKDSDKAKSWVEAHREEVGL